MTSVTKKIFEVRVPRSFLGYGFDQNEIQRCIAEWIVLSLFTEDRISSGKAARLLNIHRVDFIALLNARGIAYINYTPEDLEEEFAAVQTLDIKISQ